MGRGVSRSAIGTALALLSFSACGGARQEPAVPGPARPVNSTTEVLTATCRSMSYDGSTMDVITGLSFSLRVVTFQVDDDTEVVIEGERAELVDLAPGKVVRIHYRKTPQGNEADRIEEVLDSTEMR
jgi:hypothetical protein